MTAADSTANSALERPEAADSGWQWLSPRSLIVRPVTDLIRLLPVLVGVLFFGSSQGLGPLLGRRASPALAILTSVVRWCTTRYRITGRADLPAARPAQPKVLSVPRDRVRSVDLTAHLVYRLLGLRRVAVGTGRNDRRGGGSLHLDALPAGRRRGAARAAAGRSRAGRSGLAGPARPRGRGRRPGPARRAGRRRRRRRPRASVGAAELARLRPGWIRFAPFT